MWVLKRIILPVVFMCLGARNTTAQVFIFRDINQELLGLVSCVASDFNEFSANTHLRFYREYRDTYTGMKEWLTGTEAVEIVRELLDREIVTRHELPALAVVYREGFTGVREEYRVPSFMSPTNGASPYIERLVECLRELARDEIFTSFIADGYRTMYAFAEEGSEDLFEETGDVIVAMEDVLQIPPPVNYLNYFTLFSEPYENFTGFVERTDGSRVAYVVNGIAYTDYQKEAWFEMSPELFLNMYALCVTDNAKALNPGYDAEFYRLYTARARETAESSQLYTDIESYMLANVSSALSAFMFGSIGNRTLEARIIASSQGYYIYLEQIVEILKSGFRESGQNFYDYFPMIFEKLQPAE